MTKQEFDNYLKDRYETQMNWMDRKANRYKNLYHVFQWTLIILSALTPVLATIEEAEYTLPFMSFPINLKMLVVIISSVVAILTSGLKTFHYNELWVNYRQTVEQLKHEYQYYIAGVGHYSQVKNKEALFVQNVESYLTEEQSRWLPGKQLPGESIKQERVDENQ